MTSHKRRRRLFGEILEDRRLLVAATDLAAIVGTVTIQQTGGDAPASVSLQLFRDDGDGIFEADQDVVQGSGTMSVAGSGQYRFDRLTAGNYFVRQQAGTVNDGKSVQQQVSPLIVISADDVRGQITTPIDTFDQTAQEARDTTQGDGPVSSIEIGLTSEIIGGERELIVDKTSVNGAVQLSVDDPLLPNQLTFDSFQTGQGPRRIVWDGIDNNVDSIDDTGLSSTDLETNAEGIQLQIRADLAGGEATVRVYSDDGVAGTANRFSTTSIAIPITTGNFLSAEFLDFDDFVPGPGGAADFSDVGAIELLITGAADVNGASEVIGAVGTTNIVQDFSNTQSADLQLTKTVNNATPGVGDTVTFTVIVNNQGPDNATGVEVTDLLATGINFVSATPSAGSYVPGTGVWTVGNLVGGSSATLTINGTVSSVGSRTNTAEITAVDQPDPDSTPGNNIAAEDDQASVTIQTVAIDLSLSKTVDDASPNVGQTVNFVVTVTNQGPDVATGIQVRDVIPAGLTLATPNPSTGNYNTTNGIWSIPTLGIGQSATLTLPTVVGNATTVTNTAEVIAADQFDIDSTPGNSDAGEDDIASVTLTAETADLLLTKTVDNPSPNVGDEISFTVAVQNQGPNDATNVVVLDALPAGLSEAGSITANGNYDFASGLWTIGTIASGSTVTLTIRARVDSFQTLTNTAQVSASDQFDPDSTPGNSNPAEDDQASVMIDPPTIDLSISKTIDQPIVDVGDEINYTVTLTNGNFDTATGIVVRDVLPNGITFLDNTTDTGTYTPGTGNWTIPSLAPGTSTSLRIRARVDSAAALPNTAEVIAVDQFDIDSTPGNNIAAEDDQDSVGFQIATADLSITKTVSNSTPDVGENVTFTIVVSNAGPNTATAITVRDQLPAGVNLVSENETTGNYDSATGLWQIPTLASGSSATLSIVANTTTSDLATNTAEIIAADQQDPDSTPGNGNAGEDDIATATVSGQQIDLSLTKTISDNSPNVGDEVTFTIGVRNDGPSDASGVIVTDFLPNGVTLVGSTPSRGSFNTTSGAWTVGTLNQNDTETLALIVRVDQVLTDAVNRAEITAAGQPDIDSTPANNNAAEDDQASVTFSTPVADLSLTKIVSNESPNVGEVVTFTVVIENDGPDNATGVTILDLLPAGLQFNSNSLSAGDYNATTGTWDLGVLQAGQSATLSINATVLTQGTKVNTARVSASDQADPDSTAGNNVESEDDQDSATLTPPVIDLSLTKTASPSRPSVGQEVTFTITVSNAGPSNATGVVVTDTLPEGITFISSDPSVGNFNFANGQWTIGNLAAGATESIQIVAFVNQFVEFTNAAEVTAANEFDQDSTPGNAAVSPGEDDGDLVTLTPASADLSLIKTASSDSPNLGQDVTFTVTIFNDGPDPASDIVVRDFFPIGMTLRSSTPSAGNFEQATGLWTIPTLASGSSATLELIATVDTQGDKTNRAEIIASSEFDPDSVPGDGIEGQDDISQVTLTPQVVDLALMKVVDDPNPNVGDDIDFTLTLTNDGPSGATGVQVTDGLPDGLNFRDFTASQGSYDQSTGLWNVGSIADDAVATLRIGATVGNIRSVTNSAEVTMLDQFDIDSTAGNNVITEDDQASIQITTQVADLSIQKTVDNPLPTQSENVTFTLTLTNNGPDDATEVSVRDILPTGLTFVSATPSAGTYDPVTGLWIIDTVPNLTTPTLQIVATATSAIPQTNTAEVFSASQFDPDSTPGNTIAGEDDQASVSVTPLVVDIAVSASVDIEEPMIDDVITITFETLNEGTIGATGLTARATLPAGLTILSAVPSVGVYDPVTGRWEIGMLASGGTTTLTVTARVDERGFREVPIEVIELDQFDVDSSPDNNVEAEDDQQTLLIRAPRLLSKRLFLSR